MTIEQEFFEAFGIEPELNCENCHKYNDGESLYGDKGGCYDGSKETKKCYSLYPPITPEIVLELEEIILTELSHISHVQKYGYPILDKNNKKKIGTDWNYIYVVEVYAGCDEYDCQNYDRYEGRGKTRIEALLTLCIQVKDEIQSQVKALFNEM